MKVEARILDVDSTLTGDRVGMTIDQSALSHIMSVLTDLYSDPELAVIREYSTNALDSHIAAGQTRPIEVDLPTPLSPFLRIRDFGLGLNAEDIHEVYSKYGTSTKRDSNDVVGMLGLGCKSALTYTDQFTLTGIKDGQMTQVSIGRDEDGGGSMTIVSEGPTGDLPGVEVVIPAKRHNDLEAKAKHFFSFWDEGSVLVNGSPPKRVTGTWITPTLLSAEGIEDNVIVMGNVPYPIPDEFITARDAHNRYGGSIGWFGNRESYSSPKSKLVAFVPIGEVNFTPSREALQMTKRTKETVTRVIAEARATFQASLFKQIADAKTAAEAQQLTRTAVSMGISEKPTWQGRPVMLSLAREATKGYFRQDEDPNLFLTGPISGGYGRRKTGERNTTVSLDRDYLWIDNFDGAALTPTKRAKIELFMAQNPDLFTKAGTLQTPQAVVAVKAFTPDEKFWLNGNVVIDYEKEVHPIQLPKSTTPGTNRLRGSYCTWTEAGGWVNETPADKIDQSKPVVYFRGNRYHAGQSLEWRYDFEPKDGTLVCLPANRIDKFKRDFLGAVSFTEHAEAEVAKFLKTVTKEDAKAAHFQRQGDERLAKLDPAKVDDPALKEQVLLATRPVTPIREKFNRWSRWIPSPAEIPSVLNKHYPLLRHYSRIESGLLDHTYLYVNAVYAARKENA